jgi:hypothetical protein
MTVEHAPPQLAEHPTGMPADREQEFTDALAGVFPASAVRGGDRTTADEAR